MSKRAPKAEHAMTEAMMDAVARQFRALAEPARLRLLQVLRQGPHAVSDLAKQTGLSHANASKHLLVLAGAGFLQRRGEGTRVLYALADASTEALCRLMCDRVARQAEAQLRVLRPQRRSS